MTPEEEERQQRLTERDARLTGRAIRMRQIQDARDKTVPVTYKRRRFKDDDGKPDTHPSLVEQTEHGPVKPRPS